jgi:phosphoserine phosphatase
MPDGRRLADLRLLAMDMDSTLIQIECIDELGALAGRGAEIAAITASAMRGDIDYPESLRRRVGLLRGLEASALQRVYDEKLRLSPGAEALIGRCRRDGVRLLLVSGGFSFFADRLKDRLGLDFTIANVLEIGHERLTGRLNGPLVDGAAKKGCFLKTLKELKATREQSVAIGDGANDLPMMAEAGYSIAYRAKPAVQAKAHCAINRCGLDAVANLFE